MVATSVLQAKKPSVFLTMLKRMPFEVLSHGEKMIAAFIVKAENHWQSQKGAVISNESNDSICTFCNRRVQ